VRRAAFLRQVAQWTAARAAPEGSRSTGWLFGALSSEPLQLDAVRAAEIHGRGRDHVGAVAPVVSWSASSRRASSGASSSRITRRCSEDSCASSRAVSVGSPGPTYPHRSKIWSSNPLERLNREVKRRTDVVGIFPNPAALLRPSSCVVIEDHDEWTWVHRRCKCQSDDPGRQSVTSQVLCAYARWTRHRVSSVTPGALWLARRRSTAPRLPNRAT